MHEDSGVKVAKPIKRRKKRSLGTVFNNINNNDLLYKITVILLTFSSNNSMERQFRTMGGQVDKIKQISDLLGGAVNSVRIISQMPTQIRQLMQKDYPDE